jgi:hypothetical protein
MRDFINSEEGFDAVDVAAHEHREGYPCLTCGGLCDEQFCSPGCQQAHEDEMDSMYDEGEEMPEWDDNMTDAEADADTFRSCGWGTDEDYGDYGYNSMYEE